MEVCPDSGMDYVYRMYDPQFKFAKRRCPDGRRTIIWQALLAEMSVKKKH
jgi:hypothetical protein